ncbi:hypothetical protein FO519_001847 [Halicephalobus sp. NKZ332]|nr:hypothetical protein FO519_001847 [Halicephalobus sp. NKZ332]
MIGMINIPNDSPAEFYSAPLHYRHLFDDPTSSGKVKDSDFLSTTAPTTSKPNFLSLFNRRKNKQQFTYLNDGRKVFEGQVLDASTASKMWEQLIVRTFVHKMEDEIQSPSDQLTTIQEVFPTLSQQIRISAGTYCVVDSDSLNVSENEDYKEYNRDAIDEKFDFYISCSSLIWQRSNEQK